MSKIIDLSFEIETISVGANLVAAIQRLCEQSETVQVGLATILETLGKTEGRYQLVIEAKLVPVKDDHVD